MDHNITCFFENTFGKLNVRDDGLIKNINDPRTQIGRDRFSLATTNTRFPSFLRVSISVSLTDGRTGFYQLPSLVLSGFSRKTRMIHDSQIYKICDKINEK